MACAGRTTFPTADRASDDALIADILTKLKHPKILGRQCVLKGSKLNTTGFLLGPGPFITGLNRGGAKVVPVTRVTSSAGIDFCSVTQYEVTIHPRVGDKLDMSRVETVTCDTAEGIVEYLRTAL